MEYIKLISSFITPIVVLLLGIWAKKIATNHQKLISLTDRIIDKRVEVYETIGQELNDIFVFLLQVGHWKTLTPKQILENKRNIDKTMYINRPYWADSAFSNYVDFTNAGFETWTGVGEDAKIKTVLYQLKKHPEWDDSWESYFSKKEPDIQLIKSSYNKMISSFSEQFGFFQD